MPRRNLNIVSTEYTGNTTLPRNSNRSYLMIAMVGGATGTVSFGGGTGELELTDFYEPLVVPSSEISVTTTGAFVVITNAGGGIRTLELL